MNSPWLAEYSSPIAMRIYATIKDKDQELSQTELAEALGVSRQQVSKILKGHENLTLKTIWKLSNALHVKLISFPPYEFSQQKYGSKKPVVVDVKNVTPASPKSVKEERVRINPRNDEENSLKNGVVNEQSGNSYTSQSKVVLMEKLRNYG